MQYIMTAANPTSADTDSSRLDPQARHLLLRAAAAALPAVHTLSAPEARRLYRESHRRIAGAPLGGISVEDGSAMGAAGRLPLRIYRAVPVATTDPRIAGIPPGPLPCLVYLHGGGWTIGDLETHDNLCRHLALYGRCTVISVDYRLAPEHKFPAAVEDAVAALRWVAGEAGRLGIDPRRIAVGGDSGGGNLAAVAALALRDEPGLAFPLAFQLLIYPATDMSLASVSQQRYATGHYLTRADMLWFRANYLRGQADVADLSGEADIADWRASPLRAPSLAGLPPAYVITAGFDPLLDEGRAYAERLAAEGVEVSYECFEGMIHGFATMLGVMAAGLHALHRAGQMLQAAFAAASGAPAPAFKLPPRAR